MFQAGSVAVGPEMYLSQGSAGTPLHSQAAASRAFLPNPTPSYPHGVPGSGAVWPASPADALGTTPGSRYPFPGGSPESPATPGSGRDPAGYVSTLGRTPGGMGTYGTGAGYLGAERGTLWNPLSQELPTAGSAYQGFGRQTGTLGKSLPHS